MNYPTHVTIKLYRGAYSALYDEMLLIRAAETDRFSRVNSAADYFWLGQHEHHLRCLYAMLAVYAWKRPDDLPMRRGKPATIKLPFPLALTVYGHLSTLGKPPNHPVQLVIDALDLALNNLTPNRDGYSLTPMRPLAIPGPATGNQLKRLSDEQSKPCIGPFPGPDAR